LVRYSPQRAAALCLAAVALLAACARPVPAAAPPTAAPPARSVDLSHVVRQDVPYPPNEPATQLARDAGGRLQSLTIGARTGTTLALVAAPGAAVSAIDQLAPADLVLLAAVIDVRDRAQDSPGFALSAADVVAWERVNGPVPPGALVLLVTGWDVRWGDPAAYLAPHPPGFSPEAARLLLEQRSVAGLGVDGPGLDLPAAAVDHWLWLANLTSLEQLPPTGATVVIGALKLQAAQSGPARVIALLP